MRSLAIGDVNPVISGFFDVVHFRNTGAAFGMLSSLSDTIRPLFFYFVAIVALFIIFYSLRKLSPDDCLHLWVLSLIAGGLFGNFTDRIRLGSVVDFLSFHWDNAQLWGVRLEWPAFNIADSAITIAMALMVIAAFRKKGVVI